MKFQREVGKEVPSTGVKCCWAEEILRMQAELDPYKCNLTVATLPKSTYILTGNIYSPRLITAMLTLSKVNIRDNMGRAEVIVGNFKR